MTVQYLVQCKSCKCTFVANYPMFEEYICESCNDCPDSYKIEEKSTEEA